MKDVICEETARLCLQAYRDRLRAIVLTGSLARDEATFVKNEQGCLLLGDAEFLLVFGERAALPADAEINVIREKIEHCVLSRGLHADITLSAVRPNYLRELPPSIFTYELKTCGEIVVRDPGVLGLIPNISPADIPLEDAWRLLANRLVEQLECVDELLEGRSVLSPRAHYRTVKLYLDMATSLLVFAGNYAPTYEERGRGLTLLAESPAGATSWPFPLRPFADEVAACTAWKLSAKDLVVDANRAFWERAMDYAQALWYWELALLQGREPNGASSELMTLWMKRQPLHARLRGWAHVVRKCGWHRSWRQWPKWARQALSTSPRYFVYETATELLFGLRAASSTVVEGVSTGPHWQEMSSRLPLSARVGLQNGRSAVRGLAVNVLRNYRVFLVGTRS